MILAWKHLLIGFADICFWWTVWLASDQFYPIKSLVADTYTFVRGYLLILTANFAFLTIRWIFYETFSENYDHFTTVEFPAVFLNYKQTVQKKSLKFKLLKKLSPVCIYVLVVGFIQIWRALFHTFGYLLVFFEENYNVNQALSAMAFQLIVAVTLAFTRKNNAVNLCPTHEIYKHDELQYLDALFNINNLSSVKAKKKNEVKHSGTRGVKKFHLPLFLKREKTKVSDSIVDTDFDIVKYLTNKLVGSINNSNKNNNNNNNTNKNNNNNIPPISGLWKIIVDSAETKSTRSFEDNTQNETSRTALNKIELYPSFFSNTPSLNPAPPAPPNSALTPSPPSIITVKEFERENTIVWKNKKSMVSINFNSEEKNNDCEEGESEAKVDGLIKMSELTTEQRGYAQALNDISKKRFNQRAASFCISVEPNLHLDNPTVTKIAQKESDVNIEANTDYDWRHLAIEAMGYLYAIHHRQIFLHIFGGMFWSSTWKIFDLITKTLFTKTVSDIPALVMIAVLCHMLNQMVLFRFKEIASSIYWKTFCELLCGMFTVFLWASFWACLDAVAITTGKRYTFIVCVGYIYF